jgi:ABC-type transport system involved in cytochrome bd biosynthesis fused ATPase/permease subunit
MKMFNYPELQADIDTISEHLKFYVPMRTKWALMSLASLVAMIQISW